MGPTRECFVASYKLMPKREGWKEMERDREGNDSIRCQEDCYKKRALTRAGRYVLYVLMYIRMDMLMYILKCVTPLEFNAISMKEL